MLDAAEVSQWIAGFIGIMTVCSVVTFAGAVIAMARPRKD